jgi:hypothetical protein
MMQVREPGGLGTRQGRRLGAKQPDQGSGTQTMRKEVMDLQ